MTASEVWSEIATGHASLSAEGVKKKGPLTPPPAESHSPVDKGFDTPGRSRLSIRCYVGKLSASAAKAGRNLVGSNSPKPKLKHSLSDDMELGGFPLLN